MGATNSLAQLQGTLALLESVNVETLTGNKTLTVGDATLQKLDPGGSARDVTLPAEAASTGAIFWIFNAADAAENLVVKDDGASTIGTANQNESVLVQCDGTSWTLVAVIAIALS